MTTSAQLEPGPAGTWDTPADADLIDAHLDHVMGVCERALQASGRDVLIVAAGLPAMHFLDDQPVSFRCNPHFRWLCPLPDPAGSALLIRPGHRPRLLQHQPQDFWHAPPAPAAGAWTRRFDIDACADGQAVQTQLDTLTRGLRTDRIDPEQVVDAVDSDALRINPQALLDTLHYARACKTPYEQACMAAANQRAILGHRAAVEAFEAGASEFAIHLAYLRATRHEDAELPYHSIVALGRHAAVLHYQYRDRQAPSTPAPSLLIDAGAEVGGYAADVTRTTARAPGAFADLLAAMDGLQQRLAAAVTPGAAFADLHARAHTELAGLLLSCGLAHGASVEALVETGVTRALLPHGLGHLLGLQTHDIGGLQQDPDGTQQPPPEGDSALRLTRHLAPGFVVTIEPGIYFIPMLLEALRERGAAGPLDDAALAALTPAGGIRIEDNVLVTQTGPHNLTRAAFGDTTS